MSKREKIVEISLKDFKKLTSELKRLKEKVSELKAANVFLNKQIRSYNKNFIEDGK